MAKTNRGFMLTIDPGMINGTFGIVCQNFVRQIIIEVTHTELSSPGEGHEGSEFGENGEKKMFGDFHFTDTCLIE
jgi:hypothetical protein